MGKGIGGRNGCFIITFSKSSIKKVMLILVFRYRPKKMIVFHNKWDYNKKGGKKI